jgi:hypothetical protein
VSVMNGLRNTLLKIARENTKWWAMSSDTIAIISRDVLIVRYRLYDRLIVNFFCFFIKGCQYEKTII